MAACHHPNLHPSAYPMIGCVRKENKAVCWYRQKLIWCGSLLCLLLFLSLQGGVEAQGGPSRAARRGVPSPAAPSNPATASAQPPQPLSQDAKITLDQSGLSVDVQEQDLPAV